MTTIWPAVGDEVLVDTGCYGPQGYNWCKVIRIAPGSAARYPVKVEIPGRGEGQYATTEIADYRPLRPAAAPPSVGPRDGGGQQDQDHGGEAGQHERT